jgi:quinol-cytochrome oxidoreductase complex cytochrome b subunit
LREIHRATSTAFLWTAAIAVVLHAVARRWSKTAWSALTLLLAVAASFTGLLLAWDQLGLWAVTVGVNYRGYTWLFHDDSVRFILVGGHEIGLPTFRRWYLVHAALIAPTAASLYALTRPREAPRANLGAEAQPKPPPPRGR